MRGAGAGFEELYSFSSVFLPYGRNERYLVFVSIMTHLSISRAVNPTIMLSAP